MSIKKEPNKWTPSFLKHSGSIKQDTLASAQVHAHTLTHPRTHLLSSRAWTIAHRREGCEERCGILLGLIYQRLGEVLSGHSSAADAGPGLGPLGDRQTPPRSWCSGKKVHRTQTLKHTFTRTPLSLSHSCLSLPHQGKAGACQGYATPGCQLQLLSFARVCFFSFFVVFFFFPDFLFLASVALLRVHVHAVSPPPPPPLQWQGHPIAPDGPPASPTYPTLPSWEVDLVTALKKQMASQPPDNSAQTHSGRSGKFSGQSGALLQLSRI